MESNYDPSTTTSTATSGGITDRLIAYMAEQARMHGLSFVLLAAAIWYFHGENIKMTAEIQACNSSIIELYQNNQAHLQEIIGNNTRALEQIKALTR